MRAHCYQLLAQLTAVKSMLLLRRLRLAENLAQQLCSEAMAAVMQLRDG